VPAFDDAWFVDRISADLAVERVLTADELDRFTKNCLTREMTGATPADWISLMADADRFLDLVEPWWKNHGEAALADYMDRHRLPERMCMALINAALYARVGITAGELETGAGRTVTDLADAAGLWVRGYAARCGWHPEPAPAAGQDS
jgi:hypothetical protein